MDDIEAPRGPENEEEISDLDGLPPENRVEKLERIAESLEEELEITDHPSEHPSATT